MTADIVHYINEQRQLQDSLLLSLVFEGFHGHLIIVYDFGAEVISDAFARLEAGIHPDPLPLRDFRRLILSGVTQIDIQAFWQMSGDIRAGFAIEFSDINEEVQRSTCHRVDAGYELKCYLSRNGTLTTKFVRAKVDRRLARPVKKRGNWDYLDVQTGEKVEFMRPFDALDV